MELVSLVGGIWLDDWGGCLNHISLPKIFLSSVLASSLTYSKQISDPDDTRTPMCRLWSFLMAGRTARDLGLLGLPQQVPSSSLCTIPTPALKTAA
jgi:hypothetical protein